MIQLTYKTTRAQVTAGWWATVVLFLVHGLVVASWVSRIPAIQIALHLNNGILGLTLLSSAIGAVSTIPIAGWLVGRYGSRIISAASSVGFCLSLVPLAFAFNAPSLACALFLFGAMAASMDVAMNAQGVDVEKALGKPTMSRFHGMFSTGGMVGAAIGGYAAAHGMGPAPHFAVSAVVNLIGILAAWPFLLDVHESAPQNAHRLPLNKIPRVLFALSAIGFCILLSEGAMGDWTAVYLRQVLHAGAGTAAAGYALFSACMAAFRFLGDIITARLGALLTVRTGSLVAAVGMIWALSMQSANWALPGFALAGAGFSVIIPLVFGSGGRVESIQPGAGIATVTGIGYVGFIIGPPAIGFVAQWLTLRYGLCLVVLCCFVSAVLASSMRTLKTSPAPEEATELHF